MNNTPLRIHRYIHKYATFLFERYFGWYLVAGISKAHVLFDDQGRIEEHPKIIEEQDEIHPILLITTNT